jgi:hypothetical protein
VPRVVSLGQSPNPRTFFQCGWQAILGGSAPGGRYPWTLPHFWGKTLESTVSSVPRGPKARASHPMMGSGEPIQAPVTTRKAEEPQVILTIGKHKISILIDTGASISAIPFSPRPKSSKQIAVRGILSQSVKHYFTQPLACSWGDFHFCHSFFSCPRNPYSSARVRLSS